MHILIVGCGYVGHRVAQHWKQQGIEVSALTRSDVRAGDFSDEGIQPIIGDVLDSESLKKLPQADLCLYAVGYDRSASPEKRHVYVDGLQNVLSEIHDRIPRLIYISSSSVYGQNSGESVDETSVCDPSSDGGKICLDAEKVVREKFGDDNAATILRLSGIYGPGRLIGRRQQLQNQKPIAGNPQAWLNLVHVQDIVQAIDAIVKTPPPSNLYLLSDGNPIRRIEFYSALAKQLNLPEPVMPDSGSDEMGKRCDPSRILQELPLQLSFLTIHDGLAESLSSA